MKSVGDADDDSLIKQIEGAVMFALNQGEIVPALKIISS
jgi:hypothetical protein